MVDLVRVMGHTVVAVVQLVALVVMEAAMMQALGAAMEAVVRVPSTEVEVGMVVREMVGTIPTEDRMLYSRP